MDSSPFNLDLEFMALALDQAREALAQEEVPVGAVITKDDEILARDHNRREHLCDATAHAEMLVMRQACEKLKNWRLEDCTVYVTMEPCPMCAGAMEQARVSRLVYGVRDPQAGAAGSIINILDEPRLSHRLRVTGGIAEEASREILDIFFKRARRTER